MEFNEIIKKRFSCRKLSDEKVSDELLEEIINAGLTAPTGINYQPYRIFLIKSEEAKAKLRQANEFNFGAEVYIVVGYNPKEAWVREFDKFNFGPVDAAIVATHIMLKITDLGLSTTWVGHFNKALLRELIPEMEGMELIALFPIGYAHKDAVPHRLHSASKPKEELVKEL